MNNYKIIAFAGCAGSGKSTAAQYLNQLKAPLACVLSFADPIKTMAEKEFGWNGEKDDRGRMLLQRLGTECGRMYNPNIWVQRLDDKIKEIELWACNVEAARIYIIDDLRFSNEAEYVKQNGGFIIRVYRDKLGKLNHVSEKGIPDYMIDYIINNNAGIDELHEGVREIYKEIGNNHEGEINGC